MDSAPPTRPHAIDLPEITFRIACYLDATDILSLSVVNKSFHNAFTPFIWEDLHFGHPCKHNYDQTPFARNISLKRLTPTGPDIPTHGDSGALAHQLLETLKDKAQWTRSLSIHSHDSILPLQFGSECTHLNSITMEGLFRKGRIQHPREYWIHCEDIIKRNRSQLQSLTLNNWTYDHQQKSSSSEPFWNPILNCNLALNLRSLTLNDSRIQYQHLKDFWEVCTRLEILNMYKVKLDLSLPPEPGNEKETKYGTLAVPNSDMQGDHPKGIVRFPRLKELRLCRMFWNSAKDQLYLLICHCPQLQTLEWQDSLVGPASDLKQLFLASTWQDLNSVSIIGQLGTYTNESYTDESYRQMLQAFRKPIRRFEVNNSGIQQETFNVLRTQHFATLESFNCINSPVNTSPWVIEVLTSCPGLQRLRAKIVYAKDIVAAKPWVCRGLEEFTVFIDMGFPNNGAFRRFTEEELDTCRSVFRLLADFKRLRRLDMLSSFYCASSSPNTPLESADHLRNIIVPLPLRLKAGLDYLATLKRLEKVCFFGGRSTVRMKELIWIVDRWKNLESLEGRWQVVRGELTKDKYIWEGKLCTWLKDHGIDTAGSSCELYNPNAWVGASYKDCCDSEDEDENKN